MIMQAKRDPKNGSQELQSFGMVLQGISNIGFGILGAYLNSTVGPYSVFSVFSLSGIFLLAITIFMDRRLEIEGDFESEEIVDTDS